MIFRPPIRIAVIGIAVFSASLYDWGGPAFAQPTEAAPKQDSAPASAPAGQPPSALPASSELPSPSPSSSPAAAKPKEPDAATLLQDGTTARREGRFADAVAKLSEAARLRPDDADIQLQLGLALTPLKRFKEAERALKRTLELTPNYLDAKVGLARLDYFDRRYLQARKVVRGVLAERPKDGDAQELLKQIDRAIAARRQALKRIAERRAAQQKARLAAPAAQAPPAKPAHRWQIDIDGAFSKLTAGRDNWLDGLLRVGYRVTDQTKITGAVEASQRYGLFDAFLAGRIDHQFSPDLSAHVTIGGTPNTHYRPLFYLAGGGSWRLYQQPGPIAATVLTMHAHYADYLTGPVKNFTPGLEQYFADGRFWVTAQWVNLIDALGNHLSGYILRSDLMLRDDLRAFVGYADAPEISDNEPVRVLAYFGGLVYDLNPGTIVRISYAYERRLGLFDRSVFSLGATFKY